MAFVQEIECIQPSYDIWLRCQTGVPREWYCGIEGVTFIFMGGWNDPLLGYKGYAINEPMATDGLYSEFHEGTGLDNLDTFASWLKDNKELLFESLDYLINFYRKEGEIE